MVDCTKEHSLNELFAMLTTQGLQVISMRNKTNRLEELFMRLVDNGGDDNGGGDDAGAGGSE